MVFYTLIKGLIIGFTIAAVVGPLCILCLRRAIAEGFWAAFFSGLGISLADGIYASIAAFGLTVISDFLLGKVFWLSLIGGMYLIYLGIDTFWKKVEFSTSGKLKKSSLLNMFISTFFVTMVSPMTILSFMIIFAGFNLTSDNFLANSALVLGVSLGAMIWWIILAYLGSVLRHKLTCPKVLTWINRVSGLVIAAFGVAIIIKSFFK